MSVPEQLGWLIVGWILGIIAGCLAIKTQCWLSQWRDQRAERKRKRKIEAFWKEYHRRVEEVNQKGSPPR